METIKLNDACLISIYSINKTSASYKNDEADVLFNFQAN
ncbi:hypothetical protein CULC0102_1121 [Corynebacterium ulcerans 0102]|nr:hypothetical protein CULC0102_1121 [Corynebacterium ulcerans 0102]